MPAITALAALVPCALSGIRHTSRWASPRLRWYARMVSSPAYSPCEPALGCSDTALKPVISASHASRSAKHARVALRLVAGAKGCSAPSSGQVTGIISVVALSFIVHEPSEIIECVSDRSRLRSLLMYRSSSVSER